MGHWLAASIALALACAAAPVRADVDLWPLLELDDDTTTVLYPFYVHERDFLMIFPLYYRTDQGRDHHLLWPFLKISDGRLSRVAPIWFSEEEDDFTLLPLIDRSPTHTFLLLPPVYSSRDGRVLALIPLYVRFRGPNDDGSDWIAWRLLGRSRNGDERGWFGGYLFHFETRPQGWWTLVFPLVSVYRDEEERGLWLLPYRRIRGPDHTLTAVYPLFSRSRHRYEAAPRRVGGAPRSMASTRHDLSVLWPLYRRDERRNDGGELAYRYRRFLIFSDEFTEDGRHELRVLGFLISERSR